ncbi:hypothetical protein FRC09_012755 [Ceratobasidium sp. 395]|nr:hypothetical protein FRC09_012755 [Ceratobasidium sp. 395]
MSAPTAHINADDAQLPRRRTVRSATKLVARYVGRVATIPSTQFSAQTVRSILVELKPTLLQAPKANDKVIRQELARAEAIKIEVVRIGEETGLLDITNIDSAAARFRWQLQELNE